MSGTGFLFPAFCIVGGLAWDYFDFGKLPAVTGVKVLLRRYWLSFPKLRSMRRSGISQTNATPKYSR